MLDDIGSGMAAGFRAGVRIGAQIQQEEAIAAWERYTTSLQQQLNQMRDVIAHQNIDLELRHNQLGIFRAENEELHAMLQAVKTQLREKSAEWEKVAAAELKHKKFLDAKIKSIERGCGAQSAKLAAYEEIYKLLVAEIQTKHDPATFDSLDFESRKRKLNEVRDDFLKTGKTYYIPDLDFKYQKNPSQVGPK